jgi:hypothetical protein
MAAVVWGYLEDDLLDLERSKLSVPPLTTGTG